MAGYYYKQLNKPQKSAYDAMYAGFEALQQTVRIPRLSSEDLAKVFTCLKLDEPLLFFVVHFSYRCYHGAEHVELIPEYLFDKGKIREHQKAISARLERLARPIRSLQPLEKEKAIHDFILDNVRYDKLKKSYSHEIIGPLTQGVGVCEGIAKTVKALCDAVGLECIVALSEANPERGVKYRHAWNVVTVNGQAYHLDATFDNSLQRGIRRYDYFNLDDRHIFIDHEELVYPVPQCREEKGYYYRTISLTKLEDVEKRFAQSLRKKQEHFVFHWRGGGLNRSILQEMMERCAAMAEEKGRKLSCSVNVSQAVLQFDVGENAELLVQQPDEGQDGPYGQI